jgi:hypothetical protein
MLIVTCRTFVLFRWKVEAIPGVRARGYIGGRVLRGNPLLGEWLSAIVWTDGGQDNRRHFSWAGGGRVWANRTSLCDLQDSQVFPIGPLSSNHCVCRAVCAVDYRCHRGRGGARGCLCLDKKGLQRGVDTFAARDEFGCALLDEAKTFTF